MLKIPTIFFLITASFWAVIHVIALKLFLYWKFAWFDIPMHFIGGIVVALGIFTLRDLRLLIPERWIAPSSVVLMVIVAAMVWEVYELLIGISIEDNYVVDTLTDLGMGILGGLVGYGIGISLRKL